MPLKNPHTKKNIKMIIKTPPPCKYVDKSSSNSSESICRKMDYRYISIATLFSWFLAEDLRSELVLYQYATRNGSCKLYTQDVANTPRNMLHTILVEYLKLPIRHQYC